jgi:hypothetical protein
VSGILISRCGAMKRQENGMENRSQDSKKVKLRVFVHETSTA